MGDMTRNFSASEFLCECGCGFGLTDRRLAEVLQRLRAKERGSSDLRTPLL